jgi:3-mercaptopyruvate sulfurtransferase SseA
MIREAALLVALTFLAASATHWLHPRAPAWYLSAEKLAEGEVNLPLIQEKWKGDVLWIDARTEERYKVAHIPGALLLNEQSFDQQLFDLIETLQSNVKPVIVYCDAQKCEASKKVRIALTERVGLSDVWVLHGGWPAWQAAQRD